MTQFTGYLNNEIPSNELDANELQGAQKVEATIVTHESGARYLNLTVTYGSGNALVKMHGLNDEAKEQDRRFAERVLPLIG